MSDKIKVGDRVQWGLHSDSTPHILVAVHGSEAWVRPIYYEGSGQIVPVSELTRIEAPTLTPKYAEDETVMVGAGWHVSVKELEVGYLMSDGIWYRERYVNPVPDPCPACKGTGKQ